jgi:hypothetical protein
MLQHSPAKLYKRIVVETVGGVSELPFGGEIHESA